MNAARNSNMLRIPSHIQTLAKMATKAACNAPIDQPWSAPMRFIPTLKNKFPAELKTTSKATRTEVLAVKVFGGVMNARCSVRRGDGGSYFRALPARPFGIEDLPARTPRPPNRLTRLSY